MSTEFRETHCRWKPFENLLSKKSLMLYCILSLNYLRAIVPSNYFRRLKFKLNVHLKGSWLCKQRSIYEAHFLRQVYRKSAEKGSKLGKDTLFWTHSSPILFLRRWNHGGRRSWPLENADWGSNCLSVRDVDAFFMWHKVALYQMTRIFLRIRLAASSLTSREITRERKIGEDSFPGEWRSL